MRPVLRFKEFTNDWGMCKLGDVCMGFDYGIGASATDFDGIHKYIRITDIDENSHKYIGNPIVSPDCIPERKYLVNTNDILFARTGASTGKTYLYNEKDFPLYFAGFLIRFNVNKANPSFIFYNTLTRNYNNWVKLTSARSGQPGINSEELKNYSFECPSIEEQTKIATFLNLYYKKIELQKKKIEQLNKLFTKAIDKISHLIDKKISFCQCYVKASEGGTPSTTYTEYYENGTIPFVKIEDLYKKFIYNTQTFITELGLKKSSAWLIPINSVIYSNGATIGEISLNKIEVATKQGILGIVPQEFLLSEFLYYYMKTEYFRREICKITTHGTMMCAYLKDIDKIDMYIPDINTQKNELNKLNSIYKKIELEKQKLEAMEKYKQGLLQQLFV